MGGKFCAEPPNPSGLCMCGCGEKTAVSKHGRRRTGRVAGEHVRYIPGHHAKTPGPDYVSEDRGHVTECWVWQKACDEKGYARRTDKKGSSLVHRRMYETHVGPIPEGLVIDHLCGVTGCVNPDHLEAVTNTENIRRGRGTRLRPSDVRLIRRDLGISIARLAEIFEVTQHQIYMIKRGDSWSDVE